MERNKEKQIILLIFITCGNIVFYYTPMGGLIMAFQDYNPIDGFLNSEFVGFKHFIEFMNDDDFIISLRNSLVINGFNIMFGFTLPIAFAIFIFSMKNNMFKKVTQTITYLPHFISWVVVGGMVYKLLDPDTGILNLLLKQLSLEPIPFMRDPGYFWGIITSVSIWKELGWNSIIFLAALSAIDVEQYEAAVVDGANSLQKLIHITLPGIMPTIVLMLIFNIGNLFNANGNVSFDAIFNMRNAFIADVANTLDFYIYQEGIMRNQISYATAMGFFQNIISLFLVLGANKISKKIRGYGMF